MRANRRARSGKSHGARFLLGAALGLLVLSHLWGIGRPFEWGHDGFMGAHFLGSARGVLRGGMALPVLQGLNEVPLRRQDAYVHHPFLSNAEYTAVCAVFGVHECVGRALALAHTALATLFLFLFVRELTASEWRGAAAGATFAFLPATHAFGSLIERDPLTIAYGLLAAWVVVLWLRAPSGARGRLAALAVGAALLAANADWEADYVLTVLSAGCAWTAIREQRWSPLALAAGLWLAMAAAAGLHVFIAQRVGLLGDLLAAYRFRSSSPVPDALYWERVLRWARIGFGVPGLALTAVFLATFAVRLALRRARGVDWAALGFLVAGAGHYLLFKQMCWIHIFLIAHFSAGVALAASSVLADTAEALARGGWWVPVVIAAGAASIQSPATWRAAGEARAQADTLDQEGGYPFCDAEYERVADEAGCMAAPGERVAVTTGLVTRPEFDFRLGHPFDNVDPRAMLGPAAARYGALVADEARVSPQVTAALATRHPGRRIGRWVVFDLRQAGSGVLQLHYAPPKLSPLRQFLAGPRPPPDVRDSAGRPGSACGPP